MAAATPTAALPKRRWLQYSLRTLFIIVTLLAIAIGIVVAPVQRQKRAVQAIRDAGGKVSYGDERDDKSFIHAPEWMRRFLDEDYYKSIIAVHLGGSQISDAELDHVTVLTNLQELNLDETQFSDAGLGRLSGLTKLKSLSLYNTRISDAGLEHLKGLTSLETLRLSGTNLSDAGLENLQDLVNLQSLLLCDTQISDVGLEHLKGLTSLRKLGLWNTRVSVAEMARLKAALPNCELYH